MTFIKKFKNVSKNYPPISAREIKEVRKTYNLSQASFAKMLNISVNTLQNYEISRTTPSSTATALFHFAKDNPKLFLRKLKGKYRNFMY